MRVAEWLEDPGGGGDGPRGAEGEREVWVIRGHLHLAEGAWAPPASELQGRG